MPRQVTRVTGPRDRVEALSPGLPEIKEKSGRWNLEKLLLLLDASAGFRAKAMAVSEELRYA